MPDPPPPPPPPPMPGFSGSGPPPPPPPGGLPNAAVIPTRPPAAVAKDRVSSPKITPVPDVHSCLLDRHIADCLFRALY